MEALLLDPAGYDGTYKLVGGRICLDFVNTLAWPGTEGEHDWLDPWANVIEWSLAVSILETGPARALRRRYSAAPDAALKAVEVIKARRRLLLELLSAVQRGSKPKAELLEEVNRLLGTPCATRTLDPISLSWAWRSPERLEDLAGPPVLDAADLIATADRTRLGKCPACDWLYYDTSRNRSRRWCDMADCGSRDKALRYYHRRKGAST